MGYIGMPRPRRRKRAESRENVPFSWVSLHQKRLSEAEFLEVVRQLPVDPLLNDLIALLQFAEASEPSSPLAFPTLDQRLPELLPIRLASRVSENLETADHWIFFSKWQLLLAVKLLCAFGSRDAHSNVAGLDQLLELLLMVNDFYPGSADPGSSPEAAEKAVQEAALRQYALVQHETAYHLIGRYSEIFGALAAPREPDDSRIWLDVQEILGTKVGVDLDLFKAILFAFYANAVLNSQGNTESSRPEFRSVEVDDWFAKTILREDQWTSVLKTVGTTPDEIREHHLSVHGESIGNPVDLGFLLRKPIIRVPDGRVAALSGHLVVQRYTCGLYWDIHDALPDDKGQQPNRSNFQDFFGTLHEDYAGSVLRWTVNQQRRRGRKIDLIGDRGYGPGPGSNPDNLVVESIGQNNKRCVLFEYKVGRPPYQNTIVEGDVEKFQKHLLEKIGTGLDQEINLYHKLIAQEREIPGLTVSDASKWFFVIVVTDPYPSMGILLEPLRQKVSALTIGSDRKLYGPFILSLSELEQLEMLPKKRMSETLMEWDASPDRYWPFNTFFAHRTNSAPVGNERVAKLAEAELAKVPQILFGQTAKDIASDLC